MVAVLRRCRCARLCLGGACGAAGVPGGPGCFVCPWAVARPRAVRAASFARRVVSKPGQAPPPPTGTAARPCRHPRAPLPGPAADHGHCSQAPLPPTGTPVPSGPSGALYSRLLSLTGGAGNSRETVNTFAGVCSVSGETDDTIANQIHLFSAQFWRAKASWVSWRRTEAPAMGLTVSSCGAVSSMGATKFAQRRLSMAIARDYSPSTGKVVQNERFMACWASFFAEMARMASRWANYFASVGGWGVCWASFSRPPAP